MEKKSLLKNATAFFVFGILWFAPPALHAATLGFSPSTVSRAVGSTFSVRVYVASPDKATNAASGVVSFPTDMLEVTGVSKENSVMNLWVQEPAFSNAQGTVNFEGIALNPGFTGREGTIITVMFMAKAAGEARVNFTSGSILANDGAGTDILEGLGIASFSIRSVATEVPDIPVAPAASGKAPTKPGNTTTVSEDSTIESIEAPTITYYEKEVDAGDSVTIRGTTYPDSDVVVAFKDVEKLVFEEYARSGSSGDFTVVATKRLAPGTYTFTAQVTDGRGLQSNATAPLTIVVHAKFSNDPIDPVFTYLPVAILVLLVLAVVGGGIYVWHRSFGRLRRRWRESREAEKVLEKSFNMLRKDIAVHVARLKAVKRKLRVEEVEFLERFEKELGEAEEAIAREIQDMSHS